MKRPSAVLLAALAAVCIVAPAARASFGLEVFDVDFRNAKGEAATQAGSHPFAMNTRLVFEHHFEEATITYTVDEDLKDIFAAQLAGLVGDATAYPRCSTADFLTDPALHADSLYSETACDESKTAVGAVLTTVKGFLITVPLLNLDPPPGVPARLGFSPAGVKVILDVGVKQGGEYNLLARQLNVPQLFPVIGAKVQIWGVPADPRHDDIRGRCVAAFASNGTGTVPDIEFEHGGLAEEDKCHSGNPERPLLTLPTSCAGPAASSVAIDSWRHPAALLANGEPDLADPFWATGSVLSHDLSEPPALQGLTGCGRLGFAPSISARPTSRSAQSASGLDFDLNVENPGLTSAAGLSGAAIEKTVVTLPRGMTLNPSQAEGLGVCSEAELARETLAAAPGEGCPEASKVGTIEVTTPLLEGALPGSVYVAEPYHNLAGDSLIALYIVIKDRANGILVRQPARVEPDPATGRLITTAEGMPQLPFSAFRLHFHEGARSPLITPPGCGSFDATALLYPYSGNPPVESTSAFQVVSGPNEGPCPSGAAPFHPGFSAGTLGNQAGSYSPFLLRLTREDGEQDMGRFSFVLPPGVVPKLAGIPYCSEQGIARAKSRTGAQGGQEEKDDPSCPAASQIGRTEAGAGVGNQLTYVPGKLYLAGPYHGDPISAVAITPAVAGPFDAGTVVVREALRLNPVTHVGEVDGAASDPIPHILKGIPLNLRDLRVYADRPEFTLNATSCEPFEARSTIWGDGTALEPLAETPVELSSRYQAAGCASLAFKPKLGIKLRGGTKRGGHPALKAVVTPRARDANFAGAVVTLPHSAFLDQAHIRTICTRVQFAAGAGNGAECPAGSVYGHAKAWSPLLDQPLEGSVFLRSSSHNLPDLVLALHGLVDIDLAARIDSVHGGIRSTFADVPDAPVSRFVLEMQGGKKGLIVNSTDLCQGRHRAKAKLTAQNGRVDSTKPVVRAVKCAKAHRKRHGRHHERGRRG